MAYLNLDKAFSEVCRVLKQKGIFLGIDTLGHNPILNLSRYLKYRQGKRTTNTLNCILHMSDLGSFKNYFGKTEFRFFDLTTFLAITSEKAPRVFPSVLKLLGKVDDWLLHSMLKQYAFKVVFLLSHPFKHLEKAG